MCPPPYPVPSPAVDNRTFPAILDSLVTAPPDPLPVRCLKRRYAPQSVRGLSICIRMEEGMMASDRSTQIHTQVRGGAIPEGERMASEPLHT